MGAAVVVVAVLGLVTSQAEFPPTANTPADTLLQEEVDDLEEQPTEKTEPIDPAGRVPAALLRMAAMGLQVGGGSVCALTFCGLGAAGALATIGTSMFLLGSNWACFGAMVLVAGVPVGVVTALVSYLLLRIVLPVATVYPPGSSPSLPGRLLAAGVFMVTDAVAHAAGLAVVLFAMGTSMFVTGIIAASIVAGLTLASSTQGGAPLTPGWQWTVVGVGFLFGLFLGGPIALGMGGAVALGMVGLAQVVGPFAAATALEWFRPQ